MGMWQSSFSQLLTHPCLCQVTRINRAGLQAGALKSRHNIWKGRIHTQAASCQVQSPAKHNQGMAELMDAWKQLPPSSIRWVKAHSWCRACSSLGMRGLLSFT